MFSIMLVAVYPSSILKPLIRKLIYSVFGKSEINGRQIAVECCPVLCREGGRGLWFISIPCLLLSQQYVSSLPL
jgi:hypothetical protein